MEDEELVPLYKPAQHTYISPSSHCLNMVILHFLVKSICLLPIPPECPLDFFPGWTLCFPDPASSSFWPFPFEAGLTLEDTAYVKLLTSWMCGNVFTQSFNPYIRF